MEQNEKQQGKAKKAKVLQRGRSVGGITNVCSYDTETTEEREDRLEKLKKAW